MKNISVLLILLGLSAFSTPITAQSGNNQLSREQLTEVADSISQLMAAYHYNPAELKKEAYLNLEQAVKELAEQAQTQEYFAGAFNALWKDGPFSHVALQVSEMKARDMAAYVDQLRVGPQSVSLEWEAETAVLTVNTMMGIDTYERLFEVFEEVAEKEAKSLIIDLRNNPGGAFAIIPLVGHVLEEPLDAGMFVSRMWWANNTNVPDRDVVVQQETWEGLSLRTFWKRLQQNPVTRMQFKPLSPRFEGAVYVLTSNESASATEFAVDALAHVPSVTIIGEQTAGEMLSQKMYDLPYGFQLSLPIAEYYSTRIGKIEGKGVTPDIQVDQSAALAVARMLIQGETVESALEKAKSRQNDEPPLEGEKIYLFGNMNDWGKKWNKSPQFEYIGNGKYRIITTLDSGSYEFKIAPMNWSFDYGASASQVDVLINEQASLTNAPGSPNLHLRISNRTKLSFTLDVKDLNNPRLTITKE